MTRQNPHQDQVGNDKPRPPAPTLRGDATRRHNAPEFAAALTRLQAAYQAAADQVRRLPGDRGAYLAATDLLQLMDALVGDAALLRGEIARRIAASENLSYAQLAQRIGVSKARAYQLVRRTTHPG